MTGSGRDRPEGGPRFATRLLLAQGLVLVAGAATTWLVASAVGPAIFTEHLDRAGDTHTAAEDRHIEQAFASALLLSVGVALLAAVAAALAVSWYFSRKLHRSIAEVAAGASSIAAGRFEARVEAPGLGPDFAALTDSYNALAARLQLTEAVRRRMLADLAHEMRTPLATIEAHLEAVEDGVRSLDADTLEVLREATRRLGRLAQDVGAVSTVDEGDLRLEPRRVEAARLAGAAHAAASARFTAKGVTLRADLRPAGEVLADTERMGQVLGNLLDNALRHTPAGGTVTVACRPADGAWAEYVVRDSGDGIAAEHLPHVFDRFYRVDSARDRDHGGAGIGLAIAKVLVEAHGGGISAASEGPGTGSTFTVRLPNAT